MKSHREGDQGVKGGRDTDRAVLFTEHRRYLFAVAYRMLGIAEDAEDILQEAWIRFSGVRVEELEHPRTYLVTIVTRLCVDLLRSARRRREKYVGVWLPEPVRTPEALGNDPVEEAESAYVRSVRILERSAAGQPDLAAGLFNLARVYADLERDDEAEPLFERSLRLYEATLGPDHSNVALVIRGYADFLEQRGRSDESRRLRARLAEAG